MLIFDFGGVIVDKKAIKVLHIIPGFGGGISSHVRNMVNGIDKNKVIIDVAGFTSYPNDFVQEVQAKGGRTITLNNVRMKNLFFCIDQYRKILKEGEYDAVHIHMGDVQAFYFSFLAALFGIKRRIVHAHIADAKDSNGMFFTIKQHFNQFLTVSMATDLASCSKISSIFRYGEKRINHVMHIPNSINAEQYFQEMSYEDKKSLKKSLGILGNKIVIGHVGFFGYQKNHPFMFKIAKRLKERKINFVWLFIGDGYNYEEYAKQVKDMDLADCVKLLGRRDDVCNLFKIMDVSVLASFFEGLPTVTIETQAAGTPTVISDTITDETDMGLGMIRRLSLDDSLDTWCNAIIELSSMVSPPKEFRKYNIEKRAFTTTTAAQLYMKFLRKEIRYYQLEQIFE